MVKSGDMTDLIAYSIGNLTESQIKLIQERGGDVKPLPKGGFTFTLKPEHLKSKKNGGIREDLGLARVSLSNIHSAKKDYLQQGIPHLTLEKTAKEGSYIVTYEAQYDLKLKECLGVWKAVEDFGSEENAYETMIANVGGGNLEKVKKFFQKYPIINFVNILGNQTALMMAITQGYAPVVNYLLQNGADVFAVAKIRIETPIEEDVLSMLVEAFSNKIILKTSFSYAFAQKDKHPHGPAIWQMLIEHAREILFMKVSSLDLAQGEEYLRNCMLRLVTNDDNPALVQALRMELIESVLPRLKIQTFLAADIDSAGKGSSVQEHFFKSTLFERHILPLIFSHFAAEPEEEKRSGLSSGKGKRKVLL